MAQKAFFVKKCHFSTFMHYILTRLPRIIFSDILGGSRPELNTMPPIVGFSDMFFIQNQHLEVLRYGRDRRYNFGDHHPSPRRLHAKNQEHETPGRQHIHIRPTDAKCIKIWLPDASSFSTWTLDANKKGFRDARRHDAHRHQTTWCAQTPDAKPTPAP